MNDRQDVGHVMANAGGPYGWAFIGGGAEKRCVIGDLSNHRSRTRKVCRQRMEGYYFKSVWGFLYHVICYIGCSGLTISMNESIALLDRDGRFVWVDDHAPWGLCREAIMGTQPWKWVTSDNVEAVKTAYSRCLILNEPQQFQAEVAD